MKKDRKRKSKEDLMKEVMNSWRLIFTYQPSEKSKARSLAFLSASESEYGTYHVDSNVMPISPFWSSYDPI